MRAQFASHICAAGRRLLMRGAQMTIAIYSIAVSVATIICCKPFREARNASSAKFRRCRRQANCITLAEATRLRGAMDHVFDDRWVSLKNLVPVRVPSAFVMKRATCSALHFWLWPMVPARPSPRVGHAKLCIQRQPRAASTLREEGLPAGRDRRPIDTVEGGWRLVKTKILTAPAPFQRYMLSIAPSDARLAGEPAMREERY